MKRRFVRRAVYPSSHNQWFRGKWPTPIKKTIYQHWRERFPFNLGCWLAPKLFFAKNLIIQQCVLASPCFLPPGNLDSFNGENIFAPGLARADITADWESPFLLVTDAPEEEVPKTSEDGESAYLLFIRFAGAKAHCNNVGPFSNLQTLHVPVSKIWQPFISYFGFFYPKKVELNCWAHVFS